MKGQTPKLKTPVTVRYIPSGFYQIFFSDGHPFSNKLFGYHAHASRYIRDHYSSSVVEVSDAPTL